MAESPFADTTDLGVQIRNAVVRVIYGNSVWTGFIIGSKDDRVAILTVAHDFFRLGKWLPVSTIQEGLRIHFYGDIVYYGCQVASYLKESDMLILVVTGAGKSTENKLPFAALSDDLLVESQPLGSRGHPVGGKDWCFSDGVVISPKRVNLGDENTRPMKLYSQSLIFFEHNLDLSVGFSGAPLVNLQGYVVGMHTGLVMKKFQVLSAVPVLEAIRVEEENIRRDYRIRKLLKKEETNLRKLEEDLLKVTVRLDNSRIEYKREDLVNVEVPNSRSMYAIHVQYLDYMIRGNAFQGVSIEDSILGA